MKLSLFYRFPSPEFHSIENIFDTVSEYFPKELKVKKIYAQHTSKGIVKRIKIALDARKNQGDINHITGHNHFIAPFLNKNKTILTIHDIGSLQYGNIVKKNIIKLFWFTIPVQSVALITVISEFTKNELLKTVKVNKDKVIVIPDCIAAGFQFKNKIFNKEKPIILQIGTKKNKNIERLIEAIEGISCKLIIVGKLNNQQLNQLKQHKIGFENYFNLSQKKLSDLYEKSDILSFVSTYEGFGMPIIEANAVGRAVITSDIEPMKTVADNAALKINPYSAKDIRNAILTIINDDNLRNTLITNGLKNVKKYHPKNIAHLYYNMYNKIAAKNKNQS